MPSSASCTLVGVESFETVRLRTAVIEFLLWNYTQAELEKMSDDVDSAKFEVVEKIATAATADDAVTWRLLHNYSPNHGCRVSFVRHVIQEVLPRTLAEGSAAGLREVTLVTS